MNENTINDAYEADKFVNRKGINYTKIGCEFSEYSPIYPFATENISAYFKLLDLKDKDVLTVTASGDQALNSVLKKSKNVDTFDINKFTLYYFKLKKAAILTLNKKEFLEFFQNRKDSFSIEKYKIIREKLDNDSKFFWDYLYKYNIGKNIRNSYLFNNDTMSESNIFERNDYLKDNNYEIVRHRIENINSKFYNENILDLPFVLEKKYDVILLSNISDYLHQLYGKNRLERYKNFITENLSEFVKENGIIVSSYIFNYVDYKDYSHSFLEIDNVELRQELFNTDSFITNVFPSSIENKRYKDAVIIYKKSKNYR